MNNKLFRHINIALIFFALLAGILLASCQKDENENAVELFSFGPSPVLRGGSIKFIGQNLNKVTSVIIPNNIEITNITRISNSEISVIVPQDAEPGYVTLKYQGGAITTKSKIGYTEPYSISSISPTESAVRAGDTVTISGDYLNNIVKVIFQPNAVVDSSGFVEQSRYEIKLLVPKEASSGRIIVEDADGNQLYSEDAFNISVPEITLIAPLTLKAGAEISITGNNLDLVASIKFQGGTSVVDTAFKSQSTTSIVVSTPANLHDGAITLLTYSDIEIVSTQLLSAIIPTNLNIAALSRFKTGLEVTISGTDLDLVTALQFSGGIDITSFTFENNIITVEIPDNAIDGVVTLKTTAGKSAATPTITLVKAVVTNVEPNPITAGSELTITGTDFDLVKSVTFTGNIKLDVTPVSETNIIVSVPVDAKSGRISLTQINSVVIKTPTVTINSPVFCFIPVLPGNDTIIAAGELFAFDVVNGDKLSEVQISGTKTQHIVQGDKLHVLIPSDANGATSMKLVSTNGEITYEINIKGISIIEKIVYEGPISLTWSDGGRVLLPPAAFEGVIAGTIMKIYFTQTANWGQAQINNGNWVVIPFAELNNDGYIKTDFYNDKTVSEQELVLTTEILNNITLNTSYGNALIIQGSDWIIDKISLISKQ